MEERMAKYKPDKYDQMVLIPVSLQNQLQPGTLEYTIHELVEKHIDLSVFEPRYHNDDTGATAIHPKILLKVILFAYSRGGKDARLKTTFSESLPVEVKRLVQFTRREVSAFRN